jgi:hypothetical protein
MSNPLRQFNYVWMAVKQVQKCDSGFPGIETVHFLRRTSYNQAHSSTYLALISAAEGPYHSQ